MKNRMRIVWGLIGFVAGVYVDQVYRLPAMAKEIDRIQKLLKEHEKR